MAHGHHPSHQFESGVTHDAVALDPEHDIDARSATLWVVGGAIVLFLSLWVMVPIFMRVLEAEREHKMDRAATKELDEVRAHEHEFLKGGNPMKKDIDAVVDSLRRK
jgi:beta-lactamase regulating signal transducer with metallopeptidase domain